MDKFIDHNGKVRDGEALKKAFNTVADFYHKNAHSIRQQDCYASHVSEELKDDNLQKDLSRAERVRGGSITDFGIWQRINQELTGECIALLPK